MSSMGIVNARIWTADVNRPWARSLLAEDGVIVAIDEDARAARADRVIDAHGRVVTPGLIDTHTHLLMGGESLTQLDLSGVRSRAEFERAIAERHQAMLDEEHDREASGTPGGRWLRAHGWSQENWGGEAPDKSWLAAAGDRPVVAYRMDSHVCLVNDAVLDRCDCSRDPEGGRIGRDARGAPTGMMFESAAWQLVNPIIPQPGIEERQLSLLAAQAHAHSLGLTTVGSMEYQRDVEAVYLPLRARMTLRVRFTLLDRDWPGLDFSFGEGFSNDDRLAVIGYKTFIDGTLGSRTARMLADYADDTGNQGLWCELASSNHLDAWYEAVTRRGFQPSMHAIGDAAARQALEVIGWHRNNRPPSPAGRGAGGEGAARPAFLSTRPRIEHAQTLDPADIHGFRGVIASMQPLHKADDGRYALRRLGADRMDRFFRFRSLRDAGAILAFGSDWPIVSLDPLLGIRAAVTGLLNDGSVLQPEQSLTVEEALHAYTIDAAYALRCEEKVGSVEVGKPADLVIFDDDPFASDWSRAIPRVQATIARGVSCFSGSSALVDSN